MKKYVLGVMTGVLLAMPIYTFADNALPQVTAYIRSDLPILLDGEKLELKNPPLIYDGSTYLPLKDTAVALGKDVNWNEATQTVELSTQTKKEVSVKETTFNGVQAIELDGDVFFSVKDYRDKIIGYKDGNTISWDEKSGISTIRLNGKTFDVPHTDENVKIYNDETYFNKKFFYN